MKKGTSAKGPKQSAKAEKRKPETVLLSPEELRALAGGCGGPVSGPKSAEPKDEVARAEAIAENIGPSQSLREFLKGAGWK
jgi:hypothetical protein